MRGRPLRDRDGFDYAGVGPRCMCVRLHSSCGENLSAAPYRLAYDSVAILPFNALPHSTRRGRDVNTESGTELDFQPMRAAVALACAAVVVAVIAWALPKGVAAGNRVEAVIRAPATEAYRAGDAAARPAMAIDDAGKAPGKPTCTECGIIESVQRIDTPLKFTGWCDAAEVARTQNSGKAFGRDFRADRESLRETVAAALAATRSSTKDVVTTKHRIVVRLRNGSRQVFEENTPRMVRVGDRMMVIAAAPRAHG